MGDNAPPSEIHLLEQLEQDIVQLQSAARLRLEKAVQLMRSDHRTGVHGLIEAATELISRFQKQCQLWREIGSSKISPPQFLDLTRQVRDISALLATEAAARGLDVEIHPTSPVHVFADGSELRRALFRIFLRAFESSAPQTTLQVEILVDERHDLGVVRFPRIPEAIAAIPRYQQTIQGHVENPIQEDE